MQTLRKILGTESENLFLKFIEAKNIDTAMVAEDFKFKKQKGLTNIAAELDRISVIDCPCGWGKTSWAIQYINQLPADTKVIYITPLLTECERIIKECKKKDFYTPTSIDWVKTKSQNLLELLDAGKNIVSTHVLFSGLTDDMIDKIRIHNYILFLDEVMDVVTRYTIYDEGYKPSNKKKKLSEDERDYLTKEDIKSLLLKDIIKLNDDYSLSWVTDEANFKPYEKLKLLADRNLLYLIDNELLVWTFPIEVFREGIFDKVFILTYMFDCQIQAYYYHFYDLEYGKYYVKDMGSRIYDIFPALQEGYDYEWRESIKELIHICDNQKLNKIGAYYQNAHGKLQRFALSKNWYKKADVATMKVLHQSIGNFLKNITKSKASQRMWTCFKNNKPSMIRENRELASKSWIPLTCRATNDYRERNVLVYPINRYLNPFYDKFFSKKDIGIDEDQYAVSELIQWLFRSAIRSGEEIWLYIPSQRMRSLLIRWLNGIDIDEVLANNKM